MKKILRPESTAQVIDTPLSSLYEMVRKGEFPKPVKISSRRSGFLEEEVNAWIDARRAERDALPA